MKKAFATLVTLTGIALTPLVAEAQEHQGCFMQFSNGAAIDLSHLCSSTTTSPTKPTANSNPSSESSQVFRVPIKRREGGTPVIDVIFNGKNSFEMLLDTGATGTVITPKMAQILKVKQEGIIIAATPSDSEVALPVGRVSSITTAGTTKKDLMVVISAALDIGLLGQDFFGNYDVSIKRDVIEFHIRQ
jgi:aspartyl protease family protein